MDLLDLIAPLPATNASKQLIEYCVHELHVAPGLVATTLWRAYALAAAVATLHGEAHRTPADRALDDTLDQLAAQALGLRRLG